MKCKTLTGLVTLAAIGCCLALTAAPAQDGRRCWPPEPPAGSATTSLDQAIRACFPREDIPPFEQVCSFRDQASAALNKTAADFFGCPSSAAQEVYNQLKANLERLRQIQGEAQGVTPVKKAQWLHNCQQTFRCRNCSTLVDRLEVLWEGPPLSQSVTAAIAATERALAHLRGLKCFNECKKTAKVVIPKVGLQLAQAQSSAQAQVCTEWDGGTFSANFDSGNGRLSPAVNSRLPKCARAETVSLCSDWNGTALLAKLKEQRVVPPDVTPADLQVNIPDRELRVVAGLTETNCGKPVRICKQARGNQKVLADPGADPLAALARADCAEAVEVGCAQPAFGLTPTFTTIKVPDPARAKVSWKGGSSGPGSAAVDLSRPEFQPSCNPKPSPGLPGFPKVKSEEVFLDLPFVCLDPEQVSVVANP